MKDRIQKYMDQNGISAGELSQLLEVQRSNISHILNGRNKPSAAFIEKMLIVFPKLNARWLLTGEGEMTTDIESSADIKKSAESIEPNVKNVESKDKTPLKEQKKTIIEKNKETNSDQHLDDNVENVLLLFRDGSFKTYKKR